MPLISIILPVYNHKAALQRALASIAAQTDKSIEVIVVDDGSNPPLNETDFARAQSVTPYSTKRSDEMSPKANFVIYRQEHKGAPAARNVGFSKSKGDYVIFWDADVMGQPDMLEKMVQALEKNSEASFVYSNFYFGKHNMPAQAFDPAALKEKNYIHSTSLIRRSAVIPWDEILKRFQDWDLWLTMAEQEKRGVFIDEYLFRVEPRKQGISSWLPSFAYKNPWAWLPWIRGRVKRYEEARDVIMKKHHCTPSLGL